MPDKKNSSQKRSPPKKDRVQTKAAKDAPSLHVAPDNNLHAPAPLQEIAAPVVGTYIINVHADGYMTLAFHGFLNNDKETAGVILRAVADNLESPTCNYSTALQ